MRRIGRHHAAKVASAQPLRIGAEDKHQPQGRKSSLVSSFNSP